MTEKELRERQIESNIYGEICRLCRGASQKGLEQIEHLPECPMADDPDVVEALRRLEQQAKWGKEHGGITAGHWADFCNAMIERFSREFHVRLTDEPPGWEWTNE